MLTIKQEKFCLAYIETGNASAAYRQAYNAGGMKAETVNRKAFDLLQIGKIAARIAELRAAAADKACISEARVLEEAANIGLFDPACLFDADGNLLPVHKMPPKVRAAISSIEVEEIGGKGKVVGSLKKVKFWDKNSSLEKLMKHLGMFEKDNRQKSNPLRDLLNEIDGKTASLLPDEETKRAAENLKGNS